MFNLLPLATAALGVLVLLGAALQWASGPAGFVFNFWKKLTEIRQWRDARSSTSDEQVVQALSYLRRGVRDRLEREKSTLTTDEARLVRASWSLASEIMDHPEHALSGMNEFTVRTSDREVLADFILNETRYRRLAIIGASGAGKTTVALGLCEALLKQSEKDSSDPVPVLVNASSWRFGNGDRIIDQVDQSIQREYPDLRTKRMNYGASPVRELLQRNQIILLVDGTDELGHHWCSRFLKQIDSDPERPFVLMCRPDEYKEALPPRAVIANMAVLKADPLDAEERIRSIKAMLSPSQLKTPDWQSFLNEVAGNPQGMVAQVLETPFKIWLLRVNYIDLGENPSVLLDGEKFPSEFDLRFHLIAGLIPALIRRSLKGNGQALKFASPQKAYVWLGYIAHLMWRAKTSAFEWWRLPVLVGHRQSDLAYATVVCGGFSAALILALIGYFIRDVRSGIHRGLPALAFEVILVGMTFSFFFLVACSGGTKGSLNSKPRLGRLEPRVPGDVLRGEMRSFLLAPLKVAFLVWCLSLIVFLMLGLWWVDRTISHDPGFGLMISAGHATRSEIIALFIPGLISASAFCAFLPVFLILVFSFFRGLDRSASLLCLIVSLALSVAGRLPFRWLAFLREMHSCGVMRVCGASYQFRHAELLEHLAWWYRTQHLGRRKIGLYGAGRRLTVGAATAMAVGGIFYIIVV